MGVIIHPDGLSILSIISSHVEDMIVVGSGMHVLYHDFCPMGSAPSIKVLRWAMGLNYHFMEGYISYILYHIISPSDWILLGYHQQLNHLYTLGWNIHHLVQGFVPARNLHFSSEISRCHVYRFAIISYEWPHSQLIYHHKNILKNHQNFPPIFQTSSNHH